MGVAALVLGIIGTLLSIIPGLFYGGIALAAIALVLGVLGRKSAAAAGKPTGSSTAGMVLGIIGILIGGTMWYLCARAKSGLEKALNDPALQKNFDDSFKKAMEDAKKNPPQ